MLNLIIKNLLRRKTRTLLTTLGIAVGVSMIVALGAMGEGLRTGYRSMFSGSGADLILMQKGAYDITLSGVDESVIGEIALLPGVREATGMVVGNVTAPSAPYFFVFGYDPNSFAIERFRIVDGQALGRSRRTAGSNREILLGQQASEAMKLKTGDVIRLTGGTFKIVGVYNSGSGLEDAAAIMSLNDAQQLLQKPRQVGAVQIKLQDARQIEQVRARLTKLFPRTTITQSSQIADQQQMVAYMQGFALGIALLAVVIGGVGMTNTVMMSMLERTHEIGTLRALGWGRRRVLVMILGESIALGSAGGLVGCVAGALLIGAVSQNTAIAFLQGQVTLPLLLGGMVTATTLGAIGGAFPAWRASRLMPIEALRYQGGAGQDPITRRSRVKSATLQSLARRRNRTLLTVIGISIALASVVMLIGMADGFVVVFDQMMGNNDVDLVARQKDASDTSYSAISEQIGRRIAAMPGVQSVSGIVIGVVTMEETPFMILWGYAPNEPAIKHFKIVEGRGLASNREVMLGRPAMDTLKVRIGDTVRFGEIGFRVVGVFETGVSYEEIGGVISLRDAQAIAGKPRQVSWYAIKVTHPQQAEALRQQIETTLPDIAVAQSSQFAESLPDLKITYAMVWGINVLAIVVGGISMMNTVVMSVYERTREIGTLRAVGWRKRRVLSMVLQESIALSLIGTAFGIVQAVIYGALLQTIPMWGSMLIIEYSPGLFVQVLIVALLLGAVGGLYPAWRASKLSPVEALRYE